MGDDSGDDVGGLLSDPTIIEMTARLADTKADLAAVNRLRRNLQSMQKSLVRWVWETCGFTTREAARYFGVPKSTLQRWATMGEWDV